MENKPFIPALRYDALTGLYDKVVGLTMPEKKFKQALIRQAVIGPHHRVLDFGCGTGTLTLLIKETCPEALVSGVDVDPKVLAIAQEKIKEQQLSIGLTQYDGKRLPYPDGSFDRVLSSLVFHHLSKEQKQEALQEIHRVLAPGGELHIADWGEAQNVLMRGAFLMIQILDGFTTTADNVKGLLPGYLQEADFKGVQATLHFSTLYGTLSLLRAEK